MIWREGVTLDPSSQRGEKHIKTALSPHLHPALRLPGGAPPLAENAPVTQATGAGEEGCIPPECWVRAPGGALGRVTSEQAEMDFF